jgi:hypothetical protein
MLDSNAKPERSSQDIVAGIARTSRCHQIERIEDLRRDWSPSLMSVTTLYAIKRDRKISYPIQDKAA